MNDTFLTIGLFALLAVMVFFMFRNSRKRQRDAQTMQSKLVPGVEVMTNHGIYGRLISIDEEKNEAVIETTPGTQLRLHRQTLTKVIEPELAEAIDPADEVANVELNEDNAEFVGEPEFGERVDDDKPSKGKKSAE